jgi:LemA protein
MTALIAALIVLGVIVVYVIATYNRLVVMRQNVQESWFAIETELRRRFDLIPNIVETVKGYAAHERETLESVIKARSNAVSSLGTTPEALQGSQNALTSALCKLFALSEAYPQLKANENFNQLQVQLEDTETRISQARRFYNANVRDYNAALQSFPIVLFAGQIGFHTQPFFGNEDPLTAEPVKVSFSASDSGGSNRSIQIKRERAVEEAEKPS